MLGVVSETIIMRKIIAGIKQSSYEHEMRCMCGTRPHM